MVNTVRVNRNVYTSKLRLSMRWVRVAFASRAMSVDVAALNTTSWLSITNGIITQSDWWWFHIDDIPIRELLALGDFKCKWKASGFLTGHLAKDICTAIGISNMRSSFISIRIATVFTLIVCSNKIFSYTAVNNRWVFTLPPLHSFSNLFTPLKFNRF